MSQLPVIGMMIGDPAGIGPEVCVRAAASGELSGLCRPVLIGDVGVVRRAADVCGLSARFEPISDPAQVLPPGTIGVVDPGGFDVAGCTFGQASAASGDAVLGWMERGEALGRQGSLQALVPEAEWAAREPATISAAQHAANQVGLGRDLFANFRRHALSAEEGACTWL